jgi:EAL domain-containing protein (putative c-di-GMP-specific phosphodiesterase class I)/GGDEF domain-containing protein
MSSFDAYGGLSFRIAAIMICVTCIFYTAVMRGYNRKRLRSRLFLMLLILTVIGCLTGIATQMAYELGFSPETVALIVYLSKFLYYVAHMAFMPVLAMYIMIVCDVFYKLDNFRLIIFNLPFIYLELAVLTNPFTGFMFSVTDGEYYSRGAGVYVAYGICAIYVAFCVFILTRYWKTMGQIQKVALFYFLGLAVLGTFIQMIFPEIVCELIAESLGLMGIMIMIERDDYRLDYRTSACNRSALNQDLRSLLDVKRNFYVICVRMMNDDVYRRVMGYEGYDTIIAKMADFLKGIDYRYDVYRTTGGNFIMLCPDISEEVADDILRKIEFRFNQSFDAGSGSTNVMVKILCAKCPEDFDDADDILLLTETNVFDNPKMVLRGKDINFLLRKIDVEKAIVRGINNDSFKVVYRPVLEKKSMRIVAAEALLTLHDRLLGDISFEEFRPVAEETGFINELQYRMIESVLLFIKEGISEADKYINGVVVHIMSVQVLKRELAERVKFYMEKYDVMPGKMILDVSDTVALQAQDVLSQLVDDFAKIGYAFVLSNRDSGLLGLDQTMIDRFYGVAINVENQYQSFSPEQGDIILRNRFSMIHELGKKVTFTGLDSAELFEKIQDIPVDYIAGDYLEKEVSRDEMQELFEHYTGYEEADDRSEYLTFE